MGSSSALQISNRVGAVISPLSATKAIGVVPSSSVRLNQTNFTLWRELAAPNTFYLTVSFV
jgi:hypothetical protein